MTTRAPEQRIAFCSLFAYGRSRFLRAPLYSLRELGSDLWHEAESFVHRGLYGWSPRDTWSLDWYLAKVLPGAIRHLAAHTHGTPLSLFPEGDEWNTSEEVADTAHARWLALLEEIAAGLEAHNANPEVFGGEEEARLQEQAERGIALFAEHFHLLWD